MSRFDNIDLSKLDAPTVVEVLNFEDIFASAVADFVARYPDYDVDGLETDPAVIAFQAYAYMEMLVRDRINNAAKAVMLAKSTGTNLEHLGALLGVAKAVVTEADLEADPPVEEVLEDDERFRARIQLALEAFSTAGPEGSYIFHALKADGTIKGASATSPNPGEVLVTILSSEGTGVPDQAVLDAVLATLSDEDVRPLTDNVSVQAASITEYAIEATISTLQGPDAQVVEDAAHTALQAYADDRHALGRDIEMSGLYAAAHVAGVERVIVAQPLASILMGETEAAYSTGITLTIEVIDG